ncbi:hypothetical protein ACFX2I_002704 [Malus domestica]
MRPSRKGSPCPLPFFSFTPQEPSRRLGPTAQAQLSLSLAPLQPSMGEAHASFLVSFRAPAHSKRALRSLSQSPLFPITCN